MESLTIVLKSKNVSKNAKKRIYKTIIRPFVLYGFEIWILNHRQKETVEIERKLLRGMYGGKERRR